MPLSAGYFVYPHRRPGMDHERYAYSNLFTRKPVRWPGDARVALWIVPTLEFFPLDMAPKGFCPDLLAPRRTLPAHRAGGEPAGLRAAGARSGHEPPAYREPVDRGGAA